MRFTVNLREDTRFPSMASLGFATQYLPAYYQNSIDLHDHDIVEMFFVFGGKGFHCVDDQQYPLERGMLGVVHYDQYHCIQTETPMAIMNLYVNPARYPLPVLEPPLGAVLPKILPLAPGLQHNLNRHQHLRFGNVEEIEAVLMALDHEANTRPPGYHQAMRLYLKMFLIHCARKALEEEPEAPMDAPPSLAGVERIRRFIDEHFEEDLKLDDLASRGKISTSYLCRTFRQHTGLTVFEYIHQRRIEKAMVLLDSTDAKVIDIATACGFGDLSHFNRVFRRIAKMTPSSYRQRATGQDGRDGVEGDGEASPTDTAEDRG